MSMKTIRAVLFDLGDTLWHFPNTPTREERLAFAGEKVRRVLEEWAAHDGIEHAALAQAIQEADWRETVAAYDSHLRSPHFPTLARQVAAGHGLTLRDEQAEALWYAANVGGEFLRREIYPDSVPTLRRLRELGYRTGVVTNRSLGGEPFLDELRRNGMYDLFDSYAVSCDDGWLKPAPQLFQKALDDLGLRADEAVMVGDSLRADVAGSKALGMLAVWKRPPHPVAEDATLPDGTTAVPDYIIDHPGELLDLPIVRQ